MERSTDDPQLARPRPARTAALADPADRRRDHRLRARRALFGRGRASAALGARPGCALLPVPGRRDPVVAAARGADPFGGRARLCHPGDRAGVHRTDRQGGGRRPALAQPRHHPAAALRTDEAADRADARALLRHAACRRDPALERDLARARADRRARGPDPHPARSRHRDDGGRRRDHRHVPRRPAAQAVHTAACCRSSRWVRAPGR